MIDVWPATQRSCRAVPMSKHLLPPNKRTPVWHRVTTAVESGEFVLQVCKNCSAVQYPPRELCKDCLHDELQWEEISAEGTLISYTVLHASTNAFFREHLPHKVALVKLDCGPVLFAHLAYDEAKTGDKVTIINRRDLSGVGVFIAIVDSVDNQDQIICLNSILLSEK